MQLHQQNPTQGYDAIALHASERSRARSLLELLTEANANIRQGVAPELLEEERSIQQQLNAKTHLKYQLLNGEKGYTQQQIDEIEQKIETLLDQLETIKTQLRVKSPGYAALKYPQPLTLEEIQSTVLDDNTLLLQYSLGSERSFLWAVTQTGITSYELPPSAEIEAAARKFRELLQSETTDAVSSEAAQTLSQMLLAPVAEQLGEQRLLVVGDGILQTIPFAALPIPEPDADTASSLPLLVQNEIVTLPSASTIAISRRDLNNRPLAPKTLAVLADPVFTCCDDPRFNPTRGEVLPEEDAQTHEDVKRSLINLDNRTLDRLTYTAKEAEAILALVPENQRLQALDFTASRTTATSPNLAEYQIVHLATHGLLNTVNPELSGIVLSLFDESGDAQNGFLRLHDIYNLNLPAELVVLSACQTGLGEEVKGEGLVGLTRGFMYAGARRVTVSLWNVKDSATARLMETYYQKMLDAGLNPVEALRAAQLEMRETEQWSHPYYWAAFVVQGEWQ
jgi:CHAT domain-containing protein